MNTQAKKFSRDNFFLPGVLTKYSQMTKLTLAKVRYMILAKVNHSEIRYIMYAYYTSDPYQNADNICLWCHFFDYPSLRRKC